MSARRRPSGAAFAASLEQSLDDRDPERDRVVELFVAHPGGGGPEAPASGDAQARPPVAAGEVVAVTQDDSSGTDDDQLSAAAGQAGRDAPRARRPIGSGPARSAAGEKKVGTSVSVPTSVSVQTPVPAHAVAPGQRLFAEGVTKLNVRAPKSLLVRLDAYDRRIFDRYLIEVVRTRLYSEAIAELLADPVAVREALERRAGEGPRQDLRIPLCTNIASSLHLEMKKAVHADGRRLPITELFIAAVERYLAAKESALEEELAHDDELAGSG